MCEAIEGIKADARALGYSLGYPIGYAIGYLEGFLVEYCKHHSERENEEVTRLVNEYITGLNNIGNTEKKKE